MAVLAKVDWGAQAVSQIKKNQNKLNMAYKQWFGFFRRRVIAVGRKLKLINLSRKLIIYLHNAWSKHDHWGICIGTFNFE